MSTSHVTSRLFSSVPGELGLEGIVSKRKGSRHISAHSLHWIKSKNPNAPAVKREGGRGLGQMVQKGQELLSARLSCLASLVPRGSF
jgi:hypothetical protein